MEWDGEMVLIITGEGVVVEGNHDLGEDVGRILARQ